MLASFRSLRKFLRQNGPPPLSSPAKMRGRMKEGAHPFAVNMLCAVAASQRWASAGKYLFLVWLRLCRAVIFVSVVDTSPQETSQCFNIWTGIMASFSASHKRTSTYHHSGFATKFAHRLPLRFGEVLSRKSLESFIHEL